MYKDESIPISQLARGKVLGKAILKIGANHAKTSVQKVFVSKQKKEELKLSTEYKNAKLLMDSLGELKGISIKVAQQIALAMPFLPPAYLEEMNKSFQSVPPINRALVRKVIKQELGEYPQKYFESFELLPFGSASLGQVHYALYKQKKLAIKIQYPGVAKSIKSDLGILKFALTRFAKGRNIDHIINEISQRLYEEVDYLHEASNLDYFYKNFEHPHIIIPEVFFDISTERVLASSFIEGINLEQFLATKPSQLKRNHYAQILFDSFFITLYQLQRVHADPNPGNFIFMADDKLGMIDFGCVKKVERAFLESYNTLHLSLIDGVDDTIIVAQYLALDMIDKASMQEMIEFYKEVIKPLDRIYIEIFLEDSYCFQEHNDFSKRGFETIVEVQKKQLDSVHKLNEEYIFLDRTLLGYYALFEKMEAKIETKFAKSIMRGFASKESLFLFKDMMQK